MGIAKRKRRGEGGEMLVIATLLLLSLTPITWAAIPSFLANLDEDSTYHKCDSSMCWWTTFDIEIDSDFSVPNSSLVIADYRWDWWEVKMSSLLQECAPSLPISQIAYSFSACNNIEDESVEEACIAMQRDWLDEKGAIKTTLIQTYSELPKAESFINECLALGGDDVSEVEEIFDYYDYYDYDDYNYDDDYNWVEEKVGGRKKRSLEGKLKARVNEREERRGGGRKGQRGGKVVEKKRTGKSQRPKGGQKRRATKGRNGQKKKETQKNKKKKKQKERARKGRKKTKPGRQTSKKKKKKKAKQALKKIGLKKTPSQLILAQVKCIWLAVDLALEDCGKSVLKNSNIGNS